MHFAIQFTTILAKKKKEVKSSISKNTSTQGKVHLHPYRKIMYVVYDFLNYECWWQNSGGDANSDIVALLSFFITLEQGNGRCTGACF